MTWGMMWWALTGLILLVLLLVFLLAPARRREIPLKQEYAHRGLHNDIRPENSLPAFRKAAELGVGVELDVQLTADGRLVVFHDATLMRMCGDPRRVSEIPYDELITLRLHGTGERIPLFSEVMAVMGGLPILCEIKTHDGNANMSVCEAAAPMIAAYDGAIVMESFNPLAVRWFRRHQPETGRGQLSKNFVREREGLGFLTAFALTNLLTNVLARPDFIAYHYRDDSLGFRFIRGFWEETPVAAWTLPGRSRRDLVRFRADCFIFD